MFGTRPSSQFATDEGPRRDTSAEALAKLRPAFHVHGTVTAGNSSQTSDGAAAVVVTSAERARERGLAPLGRFVAYATAGVEPERFGLGPVPAIRKALKLAGLTLDQIDLVELNEAFAAQVLACLKELPIDPGSAERERRRHRPGPSPRLHRREADDDAAVRDEAAKRTVRAGVDVRRRRDGRGGYIRDVYDTGRGVRTARHAVATKSRKHEEDVFARRLSVFFVSSCLRGCRSK